MEPFTLRAVRAMSINGSIEINRAATVTGKPIAGSTMNAANVAPPPTPATPKELIAIIPTRPAMNDGSNGSMPMLGATMVASIAGYIPAQPFWPMVAPKLAARLAIGAGTRSESIWVSTLSGMLAAELRDVNANVSTGHTCFM